MVNRKSGLSYRSWRTVHLATIVVFIVTLVVGLPNVNQFFCDGILDIAYAPFFKIRSTVQDLVGVNEANRLLRDSVAEVSVRIAALEEAERENDRLRSILGFTQPAGFRLLPARVISVTGEQLPVSAAINRGLDDSLLINQPVINQIGLVGRVQEVMRGHAKVQLLTDPLNRVAVRVADSREMGIVRFLPTEGMILADFPNQGDISIGDTILTSGLGGIYPPGLRVAVVSEIRRPENKPYSLVNLAPVVSFRTLEELFILMPEGL